VNPPKLTILTAGTDAACDPETGTCTIPQTPIPSPGAAPATGAVLPGIGDHEGAEGDVLFPGWARSACWPFRSLAASQLGVSTEA
jgi:hypothetical protein